MTGPTSKFFPGFDAFEVNTGDATIYGVRSGQGPPLLLLHGWPQTHLIWRHLAPMLASRFTVIATDLRGYGDSSKPADGDNHAGYSKRAMAQDQIVVMRSFGFDRFSIIGHDRGARVAHRMAQDYPERVAKLVVLDIVPTHHMYDNVGKDLATMYFHWFFLIQPAPLPETLLSSNGDFFLKNFAFRGLIPKVIDEEVYADYLRCFSDPTTLHAMCEDYRAAATIDLQHDASDLATKLSCPLLVLWGADGAMERLYDVMATWRARATHVRGKAVTGGHWLPEQVPDEIHREVIAFLSPSESTDSS